MLEKKVYNVPEEIDDQIGRVKLAADGTGGVKPVSTGGTEVLVVSADNSGHTAVVCL